MKKEYREFWIKATRVRNGLKSYVATVAPINVAGEIHVIEFSAYESLQKKAEKLKDALLDILNQGNMAMQGHWDATQKMKDTAYEAIKEFESDEGK